MGIKACEFSVSRMHLSLLLSVSYMLTQTNDGIYTIPISPILASADKTPWPQRGLSRSVVKERLPAAPRGEDDTFA